MITNASDARFALLGARFVGEETLNRFYVLHCIAIPLAVSLLVGDPFLARPQGRRHQRTRCSASRKHAVVCANSSGGPGLIDQTKRKSLCTVHPKIFLDPGFLGSWAAILSVSRGHERRDGVYSCGTTGTRSADAIFWTFVSVALVAVGSRWR